MRNRRYPGATATYGLIYTLINKFFIAIDVDYVDVHSALQITTTRQNTKHASKACRGNLVSNLFVCSGNDPKLDSMIYA